MELFTQPVKKLQMKSKTQVNKTSFKIAARTGLETGFLFLWLYIKNVMVIWSFIDQTTIIQLRLFFNVMAEEIA